MKKLILIVLFFAWATVAFAAAENHYVTQSGAGSQNGSSLANAFSVSDFNTSGNWDSNVDTDNNVIGPGDTVFFSGTITTPVSVQGDGTSGYQIILDGYETNNT